MRFDWTDLQLFVHACDAGSLTGAAQRAHLTLAAVSARIRAMEAESGTPLLTRHARGVRPTVAGDAFALHARAVLAQMAQLRAELARHGKASAQALRVLVNTSALARLQAPAAQAALAQFLRAHPHCTVSVEESSSHLTVQALRQGLADAGLVSDAVDVTGLRVRTLGADPLVLVLPRGHVLARQRQVNFADTLRHDSVGGGAASALHLHLAMQAARLGGALRVRASVPGVDALRGLVADGVGLAVAPAAALRQLPPERRVSVRPLADAWARRTLLLCTAENPNAVPPALLDALAALATLPAATAPPRAAA